MHQKEVLDYVLRNKNIMPRTALRYAIEKMPPELRKLAMAKGQGRSMLRHYKPYPPQHNTPPNPLPLCYN